MRLARALSLAICCAAAAIVGGPARSAPLVVIKSDLPALAVGTVVDDGASLAIPAGSTVALVSATGAVVSIAGPFDGAPAGRLPAAGAGGSQIVASLSTLLQGHGRDTTQLGATRGEGERPADPFQVDTTRSYDHCVPAGRPLQLWRDSTGGIGRAKVKSLESGGLQKEFSWPAGESLIGWPENVPVRDGAAYLITVSGRPIPARIILHVMPAALPSGAHQAAWMAENGCTDQAIAVLAALQ